MAAMVLVLEALTSVLACSLGLFTSLVDIGRETSSTFALIGGAHGARPPGASTDA